MPVLGLYLPKSVYNTQFFILLYILIVIKKSWKLIMHLTFSLLSVLVSFLWDYWPKKQIINSVFKLYKHLHLSHHLALCQILVLQKKYTDCNKVDLGFLIKHMQGKRVVWTLLKKLSWLKSYLKAIQDILRLSLQIANIIS